MVDDLRKCHGYRKEGRMNRTAMAVKAKKKAKGK
jgi:hypothetical protein